MKFKCLTDECSHKFQEIEIRAEQLRPANLVTREDYEETGTPFFFTVPPVYCGYCGQEAKEVYPE